MSHTADDAPTGVTPGRVAFYATLLGLFVVGSIYSFAHEGGHEWKRAAEGAGLAGALVANQSVLGILVATGLSLALYSFLFEDNPLFKAAEHIYVGVGLGYQIVTVWFEYIKPEAYKQLLKYAVRPETPGEPVWALMPAIFLSALLLARFVGPIAWLSRIPVAFIVGFTSATQIPNFIQANILKQVEDSIVPLAQWDPTGAFALGFLVTQVIILTGVVSVLLYFFFSLEHKGVVGVGSRVGVWYLMIAFGASFGYTVMGRMALIVGQVRFFMDDWLRIGAGG